MPLLGSTEETLRPNLEAFYRDRFPALRPLTRPLPDAPLLVQPALDSGMDLAIATNPLLLPIAIEQHLT